MILPKQLVDFRKNQCRQANLQCEAEFSNPCARCPNGHWGPMMCGGLYSPPHNTTNEPPSIEEMAKSIVESAERWIGGGLKISDSATLKTRLEACHGCEYWNPNGFRKTGRCMKCGCSTWAKLRMATEKCPIGKW